MGRTVRIGSRRWDSQASGTGRTEDVRTEAVEEGRGGSAVLWYGTRDKLKNVRGGPTGIDDYRVRAAADRGTTSGRTGRLGARVPSLRSVDAGGVPAHTQQVFRSVARQQDRGLGWEDEVRRGMRHLAHEKLFDK